MNMKKEIILPNRDGILTKFVKQEKNIYTLYQDGSWPIRIIGSVDNIKAVDPTGGPYITVGYEIEKYIVEEITYDKEFKFKIKINNYE